MNPFKTACTDRFRGDRGREREPVIREQLQPLLDAGWSDWETQALYTIRTESPRVSVTARPNQDGSFTIHTGPGDVRCKVKSVAEVLEFADELKKAVEQADLN